MIMSLNFNVPEVFFDLEPLDNKPGSPIIEISLVSSDGEVLFDELINPGRGFALNDYKKNILGFNQDKLNKARCLDYYTPCLKKLTKDTNVVAYGKSDLDRLPWLKENSIYSDCCQRHSDRNGTYSKYHGNHQWMSLKDACSQIGYTPLGTPHRSLTDAESCRQVWMYLDKQNANLIPPFLGTPKGNLISLPRVKPSIEEYQPNERKEKIYENTF